LLLLLLLLLASLLLPPLEGCYPTLPGPQVHCDCVDLHH
jgi:hypothetical protein